MMQGVEKISLRQFMILVSFFSIGSTILVVPSTQTFYAKQDAWLATSLGVAAGLAVVWLFFMVGRSFPSLNLAQLNEKLLGKWLGKAVTFVIFGIFFLGGPVSNVFYIGNFMTSQIMPDTPVQSINVLFVIITVMAVRLGLEPIARSAEIIYPWFLILFVLLVIFIIPKIKIEKIAPVLEFGFMPAVPGAVLFLTVAALPMITLLMVFPSRVNRPLEAKKAFFTGYIMAGLVLIIIVTLCVLVLGHDLTTRNAFPSYALAKLINIGDFLQRIEVIMAVMWIFTLFFRLTLYVYATVTALAQIFNLQDYRPLVLPVGFMMIALALIEYPNSVFDQYATVTFWLPFTFLAGIVYPLVLLGIGKIKKARQP